MHLPHTAQQCPACYMYCMSRGPPPVGLPAAPPPHIHNPQSSQDRTGGSPHRTQPRAVTLPHPNPCSHSPEPAGPRPRFRSLPHQQPLLKDINMPYHHGTMRTPAPSHNIVGLPEEKPPPLPPHGPPSLPPAHLPTCGTLQQNHRPTSPQYHHPADQIRGGVMLQNSIVGSQQLQASYPPPSQGSQSASFGTLGMHKSLIQSLPSCESPNGCPNPHSHFQVPVCRTCPACSSQHLHGTLPGSDSHSNSSGSHHQGTLSLSGLPSYGGNVGQSESHLHPATQAPSYSKTGPNYQSHPQCCPHAKPHPQTCPYPHPQEQSGSLPQSHSQPPQGGFFSQSHHSQPPQNVPHSRPQSVANPQSHSQPSQSFPPPQSHSRPQSVANPQSHSQPQNGPLPQSHSEPQHVSHSKSDPNPPFHPQKPSSTQSHPQDDSHSHVQHQLESHPHHHLQTGICSQAHLHANFHQHPHPQPSSSLPEMLPQNKSPQSHSKVSCSHPQPQHTAAYAHQHHQSGPHPHQHPQNDSHPQSGPQPHQYPQSDSHPQSGPQPHQHPQSDSHPQSGFHPHPQGGFHPHPQDGPRPHQHPQSDSLSQLSQSGIHPPPQSGSHPHQHPQSGAYPANCVEHPHPSSKDVSQKESHHPHSIHPELRGSGCAHPHSHPHPVSGHNVHYAQNNAQNTQPPGECKILCEGGLRQPLNPRGPSQSETPSQTGKLPQQPLNPRCPPQNETLPQSGKLPLQPLIPIGPSHGEPSPQNGELSRQPLLSRDAPPSEPQLQCGTLPSNQDGSQKKRSLEEVYPNERLSVSGSPNSLSHSKNRPHDQIDGRPLDKVPESQECHNSKASSHGKPQQQNAPHHQCGSHPAEIDKHRHNCPPPHGEQQPNPYARPGTMRANNVPPPPPMPPPPMYLPAVSFEQLRYTCLPHQLLIPPPRPQEFVLGCPEHGHHHISSAKVDRPHCGSGPPGRNRGVCLNLSKAHSLDATAHFNKNHHHVKNGNHQHLGRRPQAVSHSSVMGTSRHHHGSRGVAVDDCGSRSDRWRRGGAQSAGQAYELSQDLADKRVEMLERRYGGDKARRAAITIQRAYRHYAIHKKFRAITATAKAQEKRLSRRFTMESSEWGDGNNNSSDPEQRIRSEFDKLNRNLNATVYGDSRRPSRSVSMRDSVRKNSTSSSRVEVDTGNDTSLYCHSTQNVSPSSTPTINGAENHHHVHGSEASSYASSRELKYFTSEDSGFASQEPVMSKSSSSHRSKSNGRGSSKKVPPEVPKRTSSIKSESSGSVESYVVYSNHRIQCAHSFLTPPSSHSSHSSSEVGSDRGVLRRSADNGSLSSVQSSGSDSSLSQSTSDRGTPLSNQEQPEVAEFVAPTSPVWKRKTTQTCHADSQFDDKRLSNISENSEDSCHSVSSEGFSYSQCPQGAHKSRHAHLPHLQPSYSSLEYNKVSEVLRKRQYRVGLNLFNKKPEKGISYLIGRGFLENAPQAVAKFLLTRKGLSKQMIGEYLGNLQNSLNMSVLECFANEIDLSGMQVDVALRRFQTHFRMPGEAQKIERLMQVFAQRFCQCNRDIVAKLRDPETVFVLAFAIIMLNTDLHTASLKPERRMKLEDFIKNLRGVDDGFDIEREMLEGMYQRIKEQEFRPGHDHVTQVMKVHQTVVGKKPILALPHRRLVCYCRLYETPDPNKKERVGLHQREVFLFNDLLVVTKIFSKKKNSVTYTFRQSFPLAGLVVSTKESSHYPYLIEIRQRVDNKLLITLNARNEHDRTKFCEDLRESILEMDEMENLRIEGELERQKANLRASRPTSTAENRDSGVADMELLTPGDKSCTLKPESTLKRTALSNSLLDIHEAGL